MGFTFWQVDNLSRARQCKVILLDKATGKRVKQDGQSYIAFMGKKLLGNPDAVLQQCFFGCHILHLYPLAIVAIVESEKTAMYLAHFYPDIVWLATGGKQGCRWTDKAVFEPLKGRKVVLFPDLMATADWQAKAEKVKAMVSCKIHVSTDLEAMATNADKAAGLDLMDYHLQQQAAAPGEYSYTIKKEPPPAPVPDGKAAPDPAPAMQTASIGQAGNEAPANEPTEAVNEYFTLQWFISEAQKGYKRSMVRNAKDYYPAFIFSYRPTLRRVGIDETALRIELNL